jgi:hypothetical protein
VKLSWPAGLVAGLVIPGLLWLGAPAYASVTTSDSCSAGGFTGTIRVTSSTTGAGTVYRVEYKINKGTNSGGNHANVLWNDYATMPGTVAATGDGVQDNEWHTLREADYARGTGGAAFKFTFDKSLAGDPVCSEAFPLS